MMKTFGKILAVLAACGIAFFVWQKCAEIAEDHELWDEVTDSL